MAAERYFQDPVSVRQAASILGVSVSRVNALKSNGRLCVDSARKLSLKDVLELNRSRKAVERAVSEECETEQDIDPGLLILQERQEKLERAKLDRKLQELEMRERMGDLVSLEDVIADVTATCAFIKQALDTLPAQTAPLLTGKSEAQITEILTDEVRQICERLYSQQYIVETDQASDDLPGDAESVQTPENT